MLNAPLIKKKIDLIQRDLERLLEFRDSTFDEIAKDYMKYAALKNILMEIIGRGIDINEHIIAKLGVYEYLSPRDYKETFLLLPKLQVLPEAFAKKIAESAGFRNAIVHDYDDLDERVIYKTVGEAIEQYNEYCRYILNFLDKRQIEGQEKK